MLLLPVNYGFLMLQTVRLLLLDPDVELWVVEPTPAGPHYRRARLKAGENVCQTPVGSKQRLGVKKFSGFFGFSLWLRLAWLFRFYWYAPALLLFSCRAGIETIRRLKQKQCV